MILKTRQENSTTAKKRSNGRVLDVDDSVKSRQ